MGKWILPVSLLISVLVAVELLTAPEPKPQQESAKPTAPGSKTEAQASLQPSPLTAHRDTTSETLSDPSVTLYEEADKKTNQETDKRNAGRAYPPLTLEDWHAITLWREKRGYISDENQAIYEAYDETVLTELARNGDTTALQLLAQRARSRGEERMAAGLFQEAAVRGSTFALAQVGDIIASDIRSQADPAEQRELALYGMAWYQVAIMRGDREVEHSHLNPLLKQQGLTLTEEEQALVDQQAETLYQDLNRYRQHLGLDQFDDSVPKSVRRLHRLMFPDPENIQR